MGKCAACSTARWWMYTRITSRAPERQGGFTTVRQHQKVFGLLVGRRTGPLLQR